MKFDLNNIYTEKKEEIINTIKDYVSILSDYDESTVSESNPFGSKIASMFDFIKQSCDRDGIKYRDIDGYALEITLGDKTDEDFGILSHIDTVPESLNWDTNALDLTKKDGWYYGLGTADDKGATAIIYVLIKYLNELNLKYKRQLKFVIGGAEERGFHCLNYYFKKNPYMTYGVSPDGSFPGINFEKSLYDFDFEKQFDNQESIVNVESIKAGTAKNVVPQFCNVSLKVNEQSTLDDIIKKAKDQNIKFENNGSIIDLTFEGKPAHGSTPENGVNSIYKFIHFINEYKLNSSARELINDLVDYNLDDLNGSKMDINASNKNGDTSVTLTMIEYSVNKVWFSMNIRFTDAISITEIESKVKNTFNTYDISFEGKNFHYIKEDSFIYNETTKALSNAASITSPAMSTGGGTYARMLNTGMAFGPNLESDVNMHQANERISEKSIETTFKVYLELVNNICIN